MYWAQVDRKLVWCQNKKHFWDTSFDFEGIKEQDLSTKKAGMVAPCSTYRWFIKLLSLLHSGIQFQWLPIINYSILRKNVLSHLKFNQLFSTDEQLTFFFKFAHKKMRKIPCSNCVKNFYYRPFKVQWWIAKTILSWHETSFWETWNPSI